MKKPTPPKVENLTTRVRVVLLDAIAELRGRDRKLTIQGIVDEALRDLLKKKNVQVAKDE